MKTSVTFWVLVLQILSAASAARVRFRCRVEREGRVDLRSFLLNQQLHWPKGIVPYEIDSNFTHKQVRMIKDRFRVFKNVSCVRWKPRMGQEDYVSIVHVDEPTVCSSEVGRKGGKQLLRLGDTCFDVEAGFEAAILHEMMHTLGFIHEQQRIDRNCFVWVYFLASKKMPYDFAITRGTSTSFPYDYWSIMHYGVSENMEPWGDEDVGSWYGKLTTLDQMKLNYVYCGGKTYCQLNPRGCKKWRRMENMCRIKSGEDKYTVSHEYSGNVHNTGSKMLE